MTDRTYKDILDKADRFIGSVGNGECATLGHWVLAYEAELDNINLSPAERQRIAMQLRAVVQEMVKLHCPIPSPP